MHQRIVGFIMAKHSTFTFRGNVRTGRRGPDLGLVAGDFRKLGWSSDYAEIKADKAWQVGIIVRQVYNWKANGEIPPDAEVQVITYDANGNIYFNFLR